jgi:GT2 family glycosyltransferase
VFAHDDIELLTSDLAGILARHLARCDVIGIAGTTKLVGMGWANSGIRHARGIVTHAVGQDFDVRFFGVGDAVEALCDGIEALDGVFLAARREVAQATGFDADTFDGWHGYDTDFTYRCHLAGLRVAVALDIPLVHHSDGNVDAAWLEYDRRFRRKHASTLASGEGAWLNVHRRVRDRTAVREAFLGPELRSLTDEVARRAAAQPGGATG